MHNAKKIVLVEIIGMGFLFVAKHWPITSLVEIQFIGNYTIVLLFNIFWYYLEFMNHVCTPKRVGKVYFRFGDMHEGIQIVLV